MKKKLKINKSIISIGLVLLFVLCSIFPVSRTITKIMMTSKSYEEPANSAFTDQNFYNCVVDAYNIKNPSNRKEYTDNLTDEELKSIDHLMCTRKSIVNTDGIQKLTELVSLGLAENELTAVDLSKNTKLKELFISENKIVELNLENNPLLEEVYANQNQITNINIKNNELLKIINVGINKLSALDLQNNILLEKVYAYENELQDIKLNSNLLTLLSLPHNLLTEIDLSKVPNLEELHLGGYGVREWRTDDHGGIGQGGGNSLSGNQLLSLNLSQNRKLKKLVVSNNQLSILDLRNNSEITYLDVANNQLSSLLVNTLGNLIYLDANTNQLTDLDLQNNLQLKQLNLNKNKFKTINLETNTALTHLYLGGNNLDEINLKNNVSLIELNLSRNCFTTLDVEANTALTSLNVSSNQLSSLQVNTLRDLISLAVDNNLLVALDLRSNVNLEEVNIDNSTYRKEFALYKNETKDLNEDLLYGSHIVQLPEGKESELIGVRDAYFLHENIFQVPNRVGSFGFRANYTCGFKNMSSDNICYSINYTIKVIEATSDKYTIDEENNYIYTGTDTDSETILENIDINYGEESIEGNQYIIKYNDEVVKNFDIVNITSTKYDLSKKSIYVGPYSFDSGAITTVNATLESTDDLLQVKHNNVVLAEYPIVKFWSDIYEITDEYILSKTGEIASACFHSNYDVTWNTDDNRYQTIIYNGEELAELALIMYYSNDRQYKLNNEYIYTGAEKMDISKMFPYAPKGLVSLSVEGDFFQVHYKDEVIAKIPVINIIFQDLSVVEKNIILDDDMLYEDFISHIAPQGVTYKIKSNQSAEVTSGNISNGMTLKVYKGEKEIDSFKITNEYLDWGNLIRDEDHKVIKKVKAGTTVRDIVNEISTSGTIIKKDKNGSTLQDEDVIKTGDIIRVELSSENYEYKISVVGDVTGDGQVNIADVGKLYKHVRGTGLMEEWCEKIAGDVVEDNNIIISDVGKLYKYVRNTIEEL